MNKNLVMVFGVFDRLHPGHLSFLKQAKKYGKYLIVAAARDSAVFKLKGERPTESEKKRLQSLRKISLVTRAVLGDKKQGSYGVIKKYKPDLICLGYDQGRLEMDLRKYLKKNPLLSMRFFRLRSYKPHKYHTSKLNARSKTLW